MGDIRVKKKHAENTSIDKGYRFVSGEWRGDDKYTAGMLKAFELGWKIQTGRHAISGFISGALQ